MSSKKPKSPKKPKAQEEEDSHPDNDKHSADQAAKKKPSKRKPSPAKQRAAEKPDKKQASAKPEEKKAVDKADKKKAVDKPDKKKAVDKPDKKKAVDKPEEKKAVDESYQSCASEPPDYASIEGGHGPEESDVADQGDTDEPEKKKHIDKRFIKGWYGLIMLLITICSAFAWFLAWSSPSRSGPASSIVFQGAHIFTIAAVFLIWFTNVFMLPERVSKCIGSQWPKLEMIFYSVILFVVLLANVVWMMNTYQPIRRKASIVFSWISFLFLAVLLVFSVKHFVTALKAEKAETDEELQSILTDDEPKK